jgi:hypothetical protein
MVIGLRGEHGLDEVLDVAKDNSESFARCSRACEGFDLDTLYDGSQALAGRAIEDCLEGALINAGRSVGRHGQ